MILDVLCVVMTVVFAALAVWAGAECVRARGERDNYRRLYEDKCAELERTLGDVGRLELRLHSRERLARFREDVAVEFIELSMFGWQNIGVRVIETEALGARIGRAAVVLNHPSNEKLFAVVKDFEFDPADAEAREFAIREAEELKGEIVGW